MATGTFEMRNIIDVYNFYKSKFNWDSKIEFKLKNYLTTAKINDAIQFFFEFKIGTSIFNIKSYNCNMNLEYVLNIKNIEEWEAYLTMEQLTDNGIITEIIEVQLNNKVIV